MRAKLEVVVGGKGTGDLPDLPNIPPFAGLSVAPEPEPEHEPAPDPEHEPAPDPDPDPTLADAVPESTPEPTSVPEDAGALHPLASSEDAVSASRATVLPHDEREILLPTEPPHPAIEQPEDRHISTKLWDEPAPPRARKLPKRALYALAGGGALLLLPLLFGHRARKVDSVAPEKLPEDLILNESDLKNRVQVSADDFRPKRKPGALNPLLPDAERASAPPLEEAKTDEDASLAERRIKRANDPEDLISHRGRTSQETTKPASTESIEGGYHRPFVYFESSHAHQPGGGAQAVGASAPLAPAGTIVSAVLSTPIELHGGGSQTVLAETAADGPLPKGSRLVGSATSDSEGRLSLRFSRMILPDGSEAKIEGEAQDQSGGFGLEAVVTSEGGDRGPSVAGDVAQNAAGEVATDAVSTLTGGLGGRIARSAVYRASARRYAGHLVSRKISLAAGVTFQIFLHQAVVLHHG